MKNKMIVAIIIVCTLLSSCGKTELTNADTEVLQESVSSEESREVVGGLAEETGSELQGEVSGSVNASVLESEVLVETEEVVNSEPEELPLISERGNIYDFPVEKLGYYTNKYWGFDFKQIDGDVIIYDKYEFGYLVSENDSFYVMDNNTFNIGSIEDKESDVEFADDGSFQLNRNQAETLEYLQYMYTRDAYHVGPGYGLENLLAKYGAIRTYQKEELGEFETVDMLKNLETPRENTQPVRNRRDYEKYPKLIQYIPTEKYYVCGNPEEQTYFWLLKLQTIPRDDADEKEIEDFYNPYMYQVELAKCEFLNDMSIWHVIDSEIFKVYSFGESQTEHIGLLYDELSTFFDTDDGDALSDKGEVFSFKIDCSQVGEGKLVVKSNMTRLFSPVNHRGLLEASMNGEISDEEYHEIIKNEEATLKLHEGALFVPYDVEKIKALHLQYDYNGWNDWDID